MLSHIYNKFEGSDNVLNEMKKYVLTLTHFGTSYSVLIKQLETQMGHVRPM